METLASYVELRGAVTREATIISSLMNAALHGLDYSIRNSASTSWA